jgi:hypothetical protein
MANRALQTWQMKFGIGARLVPSRSSRKFKSPLKLFEPFSASPPLQVETTRAPQWLPSATV